MAGGVQIKVDGLQDVLAALGKLKPALQRRVLRGEISKASRTAAKGAKANAPPPRTGLLRKSLGVKLWTKPRKGTVGAFVGPRSGFRIQAGVRTRGRHAGQPYYYDPRHYAHFVELGTVRGVRPTHFLEESLNKNAQQILARMKTGIAEGIERETARAAAQEEEVMAASAKLALVSRLRSHAGLMALVGGRLYPRRVPSWQVELPCLVYVKIEGPRVQHLQGYAGVASPLLQVSAWAKAEADAEAVAVQLRDALQPFRGQAGGVAVQAITQEDERDSYDPPASAEEVGIYQAAIDVRLWHDE